MAALFALGVAVAFTPESVPGLTLPGSPEAVQAMDAMDDGSMSGAQESGEMKGGEMKGGEMDDGAMKGRMK
jgi:hypothetical protein